MPAVALLLDRLLAAALVTLRAGVATAAVVGGVCGVRVLMRICGV